MAHDISLISFKLSQFTSQQRSQIFQIKLLYFRHDASGLRTLIVLHHCRNTKSESFASCRGRVNVFGGSEVA